MALPEALAFVDVETTGSNPRGDRVMEVGVLRVEKNKVVEKIDTLVNPLVPPPEFIVNMTGINPYELEFAPIFAEIANELHDVLEGAVFVAHNVRFDYAFIKNEFLRHEIPFNAKTLCTVKLARKLYPGMGHYNLDAIIARFGLEVENRHRAFSDAQALWDFYKITTHNGKKKMLDSAVTGFLKAPALPKALSKDKMASLSDGPGVYIFLGKNNETLYVGKSINIKDRVRSHFSSDYQNARDVRMQTEIHDIEQILTAGELGALIREANIVKEKQPIFNRMLRRTQDMAVILQDEKDGLLYPRIEKVRMVEPEMIENVLATFRSLAQAKKFLSDLCKNYELCPKVMGLEKTNKACFSYQIKKCRGVCVGEESPLKHNMRFIEATSDRKVSKWPFSGPVAITEQNFKHKEIHIVDKWCYLKSLEYINNEEPITHEHEVRFDWDIYKILAKFILKKRSDITIHTLDKDEAYEFAAPSSPD